MKNFSHLNNIQSVFIEDNGIHASSLFATLFNCIPNSHTLENRFDFDKCKSFIVKKYDLSDKPENQLLYTVSKKQNSSNMSPFELKMSSTYGLPKALFVLKDGLMIKISSTEIEIFYSYYIDFKEVIELSKEILNFTKRKKKKKPNNFYMISYNYNNFDLSKFKLPKFDYDIENCYNDDFPPINIKIQDFLNNKNRNGLVLLHGLSGTGKTTYIRYLISRIKKKFIYLPLHMANSLSNPEFIPFLTEHRHAILIIEDCEKLILDREQGNATSAVATLLNLSDGLLSNALGVKLICTFNTNISKIDKALTRKGRMVTRYEFKELSVDKALKLAEKHKLNYEGNSPVKVSDLFNTEENNNVIETKPIGF